MAVSDTSVLKKKATPTKRKVTFMYTMPTPKTSDAFLVKEASSEYCYERIQDAGFDLVYKKDVPYFYADPSNPSRLIRILNRKKEPVVFCRKTRDFVVCK